MKMLVKHSPQNTARVLNELMRDRRFPTDFQIAKVILIPKGIAETLIEQTYRPICLISVFGKMYEQIIKTRLEEELTAKGGISDNQYGFRKGRSAPMAVAEMIRKVREEVGGRWAALITIDIKNAFNTASWRIIIDRLRALGISQYLIELIYNYFSNRKICIEKKVMDITQGVPQGSILGPVLWNVLFNTVLDINIPGSGFTMAYADDLALVVTAKDKQNLIENGNEA